MTSAAGEDIRETRLANGIRVVTERMPEARSVSLGVWVGVGGRDEPDELAGASHFLEHLLFKGTATRVGPPDRRGDRRGRRRDERLHQPRAHRLLHAAARGPGRPGLEILGDVLTDPAFRPHEVEAERQVILEEILMNLDMPEDHVHTLLAEALFPGHPLGREVLGTRETVEAATRDEIAEFFGHWYRPRNLVVVAAGDLDHDHLVDAFAGTLGRLEGGERPVRTRPASTSSPGGARRRHRAGAPGHGLAGGRPPRRRPLRPVGRQPGAGRRHVQPAVPGGPRGAGPVLLGLLVGLDLRRLGSAGIYAGTAPSRVAELLSVVDDEVAKLVASGVTEGELAVAKGYIEGSLVLGLEDSGSRMARLGRSLMARDEVVPVDEQLARIRAVTADDVAAGGGRVFGGPRRWPSSATSTTPCSTDRGRTGPPRSTRAARARPASTSTTRSMPTASSSRRSWVTSTSVPAKAASACSSCSTASRSRWLVGSSSTRTLTPRA